VDGLLGWTVTEMFRQLRLISSSPCGFAGALRVLSSFVDDGQHCRAAQTMTTNTPRPITKRPTRTHAKGIGVATGVFDSACG